MEVAVTVMATEDNQMSQMPQGPSHDQPKEIPVEVTVGKIMVNHNLT
jgi:hypothetical protein